MDLLMLDDLPPELTIVITIHLDESSVFALKYTNKRNHAVIPTTVSAHDLMAAAAYAGHLPIIKWLHSMGCTARNIHREGRVSDMICTQAVRGGHYDALCWLHNSGFHIYLNAMNYAACNNHGNIRMIKHIYNVTCRYIEPDVFLIAAASGNTNLLDWINIKVRTTTREWELPAVYNAAATGKISVLKWLFRKGLSVYGDNLIIYAAYNGHLETVQWLIINKNMSPVHAALGAQAGNQNHVLDWIMSQYPRINIDDMYWVVDPQYDVQSPEFILNKYK